MKKLLLALTIYLLITKTLYGQSGDKIYKYNKPLFDFNPKHPMISFSKSDSINFNRFLRYYSITGYREGVPPTSGPFETTFRSVADSILGTRRIYMYNLSLTELFNLHFGRDNQILLEVKDPSKYRYFPEYGSKEQWLRKNAWCFELMVPLGNPKMLEVVRDILRTHFNVEFKKMHRKIPVVVIEQLSKLEKFKYKGSGVPRTDYKRKFINVPLNYIADAMGYTGKPFIDDTHFQGNIDVVLDVKDWKSIDSINKELIKYDLFLKEEVREIDLFVIKEINKISE